MMMSRRDAVAAFALFAEFAASAGVADAQPQLAPSPPRPPLFTHDLPNLTLDGWEVTVSLVDYAPGRVGSVHHRAGFVLAYVLEGAVITRISGQGEEKTYSAGQMFTNSPARRTRSRKMPVRHSARGSSR